MYRAYLALHPHSLNHSKNSVPGGFPSNTFNNGNSPDFSRKILLTTEKPTQAIGRSSRNATKGLFATKENGFFESPVMSRQHAEVEMISEPSRKIIIRDTNSMHGTFINGLQLHPDETAELREGTEVTFGAEVTRSDLMYPAKTFRCEVKWEQSRPSSPSNTTKDRTSTSRGGYGIDEDQLMESDFPTDSEQEEDDDGREGYMDEDASDDDDNDSTSSGRLSSPESARSASDSPALSLDDKPAPSSDSRISAYMRDDDVPESNERTKDMSVSSIDNVTLDHLFEATEMEIVDLEPEERQADIPKQRQRMPTIPSLINKDHTDPETSANSDESEDEGDVTIVSKPDIFAKSAKNDTMSQAAKEKHRQTIYIPDSDDEDDEVVCKMVDDIEDPESEDEEQVEGTEECEKEEDSRQESGKPEKDVLATTSDETRKGEATNLAAPLPNVVGIAMESSPSGTPPVLPSLQALPPLPTPPARHSMLAPAPHIHWSTTPFGAEKKTFSFHEFATPSTAPNYMNEKKAYFDARAHNMMVFNEQNPRTSYSQLRDTKTSTHPSWGNWEGQKKVSEAATEDDVMKPMGGFKDTVQAQIHDVARAQIAEVDAFSNKHDAIDQNDDDDKDLGEEDADYESEDLPDDVESQQGEEEDQSAMDKEIGDLVADFEDEVEPTFQLPVKESEIVKGAGSYSKFSIHDLVAQSPPASSPVTATKTLPIPVIGRDLSSSFVSPPPSDTSSVHAKESSPIPMPERSKTAAALEDILNPRTSPPALSSPLNSLKRKHDSVSTEENTETPEKGESPLSVRKENTTHPIKKVKKQGGLGFVKIATAAFAGAVVGGAGVFAALVATAP